MKKAYEKFCTSMSYEEFVNMIVEKLKGSSSTVSSSELFDLLGYENINFIEYIIELRKQVVAWYTNQKLTKTFSCKIFYSTVFIELIIIFHYYF